MARTSPAPNIPPIPGMCPGVAVLGGGGGGGGAGGKGSKKGKGKKGAGKKKGKKGAKGGKKNGKKGKKSKCGGNGKSAKCTKCSSSPTAGEPIDLASGAVIVPETVDMELPGPIGLEWQRSYDSADADSDGPLGYGWSFTFGWEFVVEGKLAFIRHAGEVHEFSIPDIGDTSEADDGWVLERDEQGFGLWCGDDFIHVFRPLAQDPSRIVLAVLLGPSNNRITLDYDHRGRLCEVRDSVGRIVRVVSDQRGRILSIDVPDPAGNTIVFARYAYDERGDLVAVTDADGRTTRYAYDERHRLQAQVLPSTLTFHYRYDDQGRAVESWGDYPDGRPDPSVVLAAFLADGVTRARGVHHVRITYHDEYREVVSATEVQHVFTNADGDQVTKSVGNGGVTTRTYDEQGNELSLTDANGATTTYEYDDAGRLVRETDPLDQSVQLVRDEYGYVMKMIDPAGGEVTVTRDRRGFIESITNQVGALTSYVWDERGLMRELGHPNGSRSTFEVDAHGNPVIVREPNGAVWRFGYDWWGRVTERIDPMGHSTENRYSPAGLLSAFRERDGGWTVVTRDEMTNPVEVVLPDGAVERRRWGALNWLYEETSPTGVTVRGRYDADGQLIAVANGRGETLELDWGPEGAPRRVVNFGGLEELRRFDANGDMVAEDLGEGNVAYTRDANGNITSAEYPDGSTEAFEYDTRGELVVARNGGGELRVTRNAVGQVVTETMTVDGEVTVVRTTYSPDARRTRVETSWDLGIDYRRDAVGDVSGIGLGSDDYVTLVRNALGGVVEHRLPRGGLIISEYDALTRLTARRVRRAAPTATAATEPAWVGRQVTGEVTKSFAYSARSELVLAADNALGDVAMRYDPDGRLVMFGREGQKEETFAYDGAGNVHEVEPELRRRYDAGDRILSRGNTHYEYDRCGRRVAKFEQSPDGGERVWRYLWSAADELVSVECPDGRFVRFTYDAFRRRLTKRVLREDVLVSASRYLWDESQLLQERITTYGDDGAVRRSELRSYAFEDKHVTSPFAEHLRVVERDAVRDEGWVFYCTDILGTPEELVGPDGTIAGVLRRAAWGMMVAEGQRSTPLRFPGQYFDEETGLAYNYKRYYDAQTGQYISPDPIGIEGGLNIYAYCSNPVTASDPYGLAHGMFFEVRDNEGTEIGPDPGKSNKPGDWSPLQSGKNGKPFKADKFGQCGTGDTEAKALHNLDNNKKARDALANGGSAKMGGEFPPCKRCHRRIKKWMEKKGGTGKIDYHYPVNQKITYNGGKSGKPPVETAKGTNASKLVNAYDNDKYVKTKTPARNDDGSIKKDANGKTVYKRQSTASNEYQRQKEIAQNNPGKVKWPDQSTKDEHLGR